MSISPKTNRAAYYQEQAEQCRRLAMRAAHADSRLSLQRASETWRMLADLEQAMEGGASGRSA